MRMTSLEQTSRERLSDLISKYVKEEENYQHLVDIVNYINGLEENRLGYWNYTISRCISLLFAEGALNTGCRDFYKVIDILERLKFETLTAASYNQQKPQRRSEGTGAAGDPAADLARLVRFASTPPNSMWHEDIQYLTGVLETVKQKFFRKVVYKYEDKSKE